MTVSEVDTTFVHGTGYWQQQQPDGTWQDVTVTGPRKGRRYTRILAHRFVRGYQLMEGAG